MFFVATEPPVATGNNCCTAKRYIPSNKINSTSSFQISFSVFPPPKTAVTLNFGFRSSDLFTSASISPHPKIKHHVNI